jgi:hypothetical protein
MFLFLLRDVQVKNEKPVHGQSGREARKAEEPLASMVVHEVDIRRHDSAMPSRLLFLSSLSTKPPYKRDIITSAFFTLETDHQIHEKA